MINFLTGVLSIENLWEAAMAKGPTIAEMNKQERGGGILGNMYAYFVQVPVSLLLVLVAYLAGSLCNIIEKRNR